MAIYIKSEIKNIIKQNFVHSAYDKAYNFNAETHLSDFANRIHDIELPFDEAKKEQEDFLKEIDELDGRIEPSRENNQVKKFRKYEEGS